MSHIIEFSSCEKLFVEPCCSLVIEISFICLDKKIDVLSRDTIETTQMPLHLVPEILDIVDMVSILGKFLKFINAIMPKVRDIQRIIDQ